MTRAVLAEDEDDYESACHLRQECIRTLAHTSQICEVQLDANPRKESIPRSLPVRRNREYRVRVGSWAAGRKQAGEYDSHGGYHRQSGPYKEQAYMGVIWSARERPDVKEEGKNRLRELAVPSTNLNAAAAGGGVAPWALEGDDAPGSANPLSRMADAEGSAKGWEDGGGSPMEARRQVGLSGLPNARHGVLHIVWGRQLLGEWDGKGRAHVLRCVGFWTLRTPFKLVLLAHFVCGLCGQGWVIQYWGTRFLVVSMAFHGGVEQLER
ncbi:hypothetical protein B0H14DRAFT_2623962 [Mycena olivaceomarginata]|nr:hypothetical protein B0H14DRAFT_2623962 [Mycena olivaceomarginata]